MAPVRAGRSHTRLNRRPDLPGSRTHTLPVALATSIAAARSTTSSCSASGISTGSTIAGFCLVLRRAPTSLALQSNPFHSIGWAARGPRSRETEILTGVLEATVRDPCRSGPGAKLVCGLAHPRNDRRRQATRTHFHAREASPGGIWSLSLKPAMPFCVPTYSKSDANCRVSLRGPPMLFPYHKRLPKSWAPVRLVQQSRFVGYGVEARTRPCWCDLYGHVSWRFSAAGHRARRRQPGGRGQQGPLAL